MANQTVARDKAIYHGDNKAEAIARAKEIKGQCIYSWKDPSRTEWGYWSEPGGGGSFLRNGEQQVWPKVRS